MTKPSLEKINPTFGSSFTLRKFTGPTPCPIPFWHFHPEYEIVYVAKGRGTRHIGSHISHFNGGDLVFIGPNLPHLCFDEAMTEENLEIVVQMKEDFLSEDFLNKPEMRDIRTLFERAQIGIAFHPSVQKNIGKRLVKMLEMPPFDRLMELLSVLQTLATTPHYTSLNAQGLLLEVKPQDSQRIEKLYDFVQKNFKNPIELENVATEIHMTVPAFCRYFKRLTGKTFTHFLNEMRVTYACQLLSSDHQTISNICFESGFNNLSHFNRQFKEITGASPKIYRKNIQKLVV